MAFSPVSFLLGVGVAYILPVVSRSFRSLAVEATAMGMGALEDVRRVMAEQLENLEDIAAEARARREQLAGGVELETEPDAEVDEGDDRAEEDPEAAPDTRARRRPSPRSRHSSE